MALLFVFLLGIAPQVMAFTSGQTAVTVIGQSNFNLGTANHGEGGSSVAFGIFLARDIAFDSHGDLWVADTNNNRVIEFVPGTGTCSTGVLCSNMAATLVIGQTSMTANGANEGAGATATSSSLSSPYDVAFDAQGNLWVVDSSNNRVLEFAYPFSNGEAASVVIGQTSFSANSLNEGGSNPSASSLDGPTALAFDSSGDLWVADRYNSRVLEYVPGTSGCAADTLCSGMSATKVLGQSSFTVQTPGYLTATGMYDPYGLAFAPNGNLWVDDSNNGRVLEFASPFSTGEAASVVLSDATFTTETGSFCRPETLNASSLCGSEGIAVDSSGDVWVADSFNNRVLEFVAGTSGCSSGQFCNNMAATVVLGQTSFTTSSGATTATGLNDPYGLAFDQNGNLWVSDYNNNRVLEYQGSESTTSSSTTSSSSSTTSTSTTSSSTTTSSSSSSFGVAATPVCPSASGGTYMPVGATFADQYGNVWAAPGGSANGGTYSSYFFPGPPSAVPPPMLQGWGGDYGTYNGQQGWIVTFFCGPQVVF
jgi:sugar lactone lactonase YvrE